MMMADSSLSCFGVYVMNGAEYACMVLMNVRVSVMVSRIGSGEFFLLSVDNAAEAACICGFM
jgi:hypothetical protein